MDLGLGFYYREMMGQVYLNFEEIVIRFESELQILLLKFFSIDEWVISSQVT